MATRSKQATGQRNRPPYTVLLTVICISVIGTYFSTTLYSHATLSSRSRLPASAIASLATDTPVPYFADKRNFLNQFFVKYAWAWSVSLALAHIVVRELFPAQLDSTASSSIATTPVPTATNSSPSGGASKRIIVDLLRWSSGSFWWYFLTQKTWFFGTGPSVSHRLLVLTGAKCVPHSHAAVINSSEQSPATHDASTPNALAPDSLLSEQCGRGMYWTGGHDVSGHTFLLTLSILLLFETVRSSSKEFRSGTHALPLPHFVTMAAIYVLIAVWAIMLAATSLFFHSPAEKMSGLAFGIAAWWASRGGKTGCPSGLALFFWTIEADATTQGDIATN